MLDHRIETLLVLSETLSYTRTAELLHLTQPAVSQHIRYLERQYDCRIFEQHGRQLVITEPGRRLIRSAQTMRANSRRIDLEMRSQQSQTRKLRIGATKTIGNYVIARPLGGFMRAHPDYEIRLDVENTSVLLGQLNEGDLDVLFLEGNFDKQRYAHRLYQWQDFIGICSPESDLAGRSVTFSQLAARRLIVREDGSGTREILEHVLRQQSLELNHFGSLITISQFSIIKELVRQDLGISFVYRSVAARELADGRLAELAIEGFSHRHEFQIVTLPEPIATDVIEPLVDWMIADCSAI